MSDCKCCPVWQADCPTCQEVKKNTKLKLKDITTEDGSISLSKLTGHKIKDIQGFIVNEEWDATFVVSRIVFENGNTLFMGGEHDMPFIDDEDAELNMDTDTLEDLYNQQED